MQRQDLPEEDLDSLCAAVAAETGVPVGRVKKVLLSARHHQQSGRAPRPRAIGQDRADPLRYHPLGANGRIHPPIQQASTDDADNPA